MESDRSRQSVGSKVLVLNTTCLPINICSWKRAIVLVIKGKAEGLESGKKSINNGKYSLPLVIKLRDYVPIPYNGVVFTRKNIFLRDNYTCQYCGKTKNLTIDHVIPKSKGGEDVWENVVSCCVRCNNKKGDRMPEEEGMKLMGTPYRPPSSLYLQITRQASVPQSWFTYFFKSSASN
jgi:5-methylcytosine-specific restriction endonuclease McrA